MSEAITRFEGEHRFLSNFSPHPVEYGGRIYKTAEHAFQAQKAVSTEDKLLIKHASTPGQAKRLGRKIRIKDDWDVTRYQIMLHVVRSKFRDPELAKLLLATGDAHLEEGNLWGDRFWGTVHGEGQNNLGKILMRVREEIKPWT